MEDTCSTSKMHKLQQHHENVLSKHQNNPNIISAIFHYSSQPYQNLSVQKQLQKLLVYVLNSPKGWQQLFVNIYCISKNQSCNQQNKRFNIFSIYFSITFQQHYNTKLPTSNRIQLVLNLILKSKHFQDFYTNNPRKQTITLNERGKLFFHTYIQVALLGSSHISVPNCKTMVSKDTLKSHFNLSISFLLFNPKRILSFRKIRKDLITYSQRNW